MKKKIQDQATLDKKAARKAKVEKLGQKVQDFAQKIAQNKLVSSIMEGFILVMPIIIASTIFIMMAELAPSFGLKFKDNPNHWYNDYYAFCMRLYNASYGLLGIALCITISSRLTDKINATLKPEKKMNMFVICTGALVAYILMSLGYSKDGSFQTILFEIFGVKGIFIGILTALSSPWIFYLCYRYNITIRLPKQVPQNISQAFLCIFPMFFTILIYGTIGFLFAFFLKDSMLNVIFKLLTPLLEGAKSNYFFVTWSFVLSLTWFCGIHPKVWSGISDTLLAIGLKENQQAVENNLKPTNLWADPLQMGAFSMGGSGAQIAVPIIIIIFCKSKQLKSIGLVALAPIMFQVNEPILFGVPSILNPLIAFPFLVTPIINSILAIVFVELFNMKASFIAMPWSTPMWLAIPISVSFQPISFLLPWLWFAVSFGLYFPFIMSQDRIYYKKEISVETEEFVDYRSGIQVLRDMIFQKERHKEIKAKILEEKIKQKNKENENIKNITNSKIDLNKNIEILVVCIGAGSSAMLAETINKAFAETKYKINAKACSRGGYSEFIDDTNLVIISPQAKAIEKDLLNYSKTSNLIVFQTKGSEFLKMINDKKYAMEQVLNKLEENENEKI